METQVFAKPSQIKPWLKSDNHKYTELKMAECSAYDYIHTCNRSRLDSVAINYLDTEISYRKLFDNIQKTARSLLAADVHKGDIITICSVMTPELIYLFYAMSIIGATPNMIDPRTSAKGMREYMEEVDSKLAFTLDAAYPAMKEAVKGTEVKKLVVISPVESLPRVKQFFYKLSNKGNGAHGNDVLSWKEFFAKGTDGEPLAAAYDPKHAAVIVHTGGTTGISKCVMLSDYAFNAMALQGACQEFGPGQKFMNIMPPFIAYGYGVGVHMPLSFGETVVVIPKFNPEDFARLILKYKAEHMAGVPAHYQIMMKDPCMKGKDLSFITVSGAGGDGINVGAEQEVNDFLKAHHAPFMLTKGYGMTECCSMVVTNYREHNKLGSVGQPLHYSDVGIFEPGTDKELGFNELGEVCIAGPNLMLGYYNNPEETEKVLKVHSDGKTWLHTGDIARMDEDGYLFISARIKRIIIRHDGFKVFPTAIENLVGTHEAVETCCAVRIRDSAHVQGDLPILYVVLKKGIAKEPEQIKAELKALCAEKLAEYVQPVEILFREKLPYTGIGKIDYKTLESEYESTADLKNNLGG